MEVDFSLQLGSSFPRTTHVIPPQIQSLVIKKDVTIQLVLVHSSFLYFLYDNRLIAVYHCNLPLTSFCIKSPTEVLKDSIELNVYAIVQQEQLYQMSFLLPWKATSKTITRRITFPTTHSYSQIQSFDSVQLTHLAHLPGLQQCLFFRHQLILTSILFPTMLIAESQIEEIRATCEQSAPICWTSYQLDGFEGQHVGPILIAQNAPFTYAQTEFTFFQGDLDGTVRWAPLFYTSRSCSSTQGQVILDLKQPIVGLFQSRITKEVVAVGQYGKIHIVGQSEPRTIEFGGGLDGICHVALNDQDTLLIGTASKSFGIHSWRTGETLVVLGPFPALQCLAPSTHETCFYAITSERQKLIQFQIQIQTQVLHESTSTSTSTSSETQECAIKHALHRIGKNTKHYHAVQHQSMEINQHLVRVQHANVVLQQHKELLRLDLWCRVRSPWNNARERTSTSLPWSIYLQVSALCPILHLAGWSVQVCILALPGVIVQHYHLSCPAKITLDEPWTIELEMPIITGLFLTTVAEVRTEFSFSAAGRILFEFRGLVKQLSVLDATLALRSAVPSSASQMTGSGSKRENDDDVFGWKVLSRNSSSSGEVVSFDQTKLQRQYLVTCRHSCTITVHQTSSESSCFEYLQSLFRKSEEEADLTRLTWDNDLHACGGYFTNGNVFVVKAIEHHHTSVFELVLQVACPADLYPLHQALLLRIQARLKRNFDKNGKLCGPIQSHLAKLHHLFIANSEWRDTLVQIQEMKEHQDRLFAPVNHRSTTGALVNPILPQEYQQQVAIHLGLEQHLYHYFMKLRHETNQHLYTTK